MSPPCRHRGNVVTRRAGHAPAPCPLCRAHKTHLQHVFTAAAINLSRLGSWLAGTPRARTRQSAFVRLMAMPAPSDDFAGSIRTGVNPRALLRLVHRKANSPWRPPECHSARGRHHGLHRPAQRRPQAVPLDQVSVRYPGQRRTLLHSHRANRGRPITHQISGSRRWNTAPNGKASWHQSTSAIAQRGSCPGSG